MIVSSLVALALLAQSPSPTLDERAVIAAEKAAEAAQRAADAAQKSAEALATLAALESKEAGAPAAKPAEAAKPEPSPWSGGASLGLTYLTGNSNSITFSGAAGIQRKSEKWILGAKLFGGYGQTTTAINGAEVVALNAGLSAQIDYRVIERVSILVAGGIDTDHVKSIEVRGFGELGAGVMWLDKKEEDYQKLFLRTDLTFRIQQEARYDYYPVPGDQADVLMVAPRLALQFRYALNKFTAFQEDFEVMPNVVGAPRVLLNSTSKLTVRIMNNIGISLGFTVKFDSAPAPGKVSTDTATVASLEATF